MGTGDSIHILTIFYRQLNLGDSKEDAIAYAFVHSGPAVLTTTVTTAAGLMSLGFAELTALAHMGIMCAAGVTMALFYTMFLIPSLIAIFPLKQKVLSGEKSTAMDTILIFFSNFSTNHPKKITGVCLVILALSLFIASKNRFSNYPISYLPDNLALKTETLYIDKVLNGTIPLEIVIDTKKENGVHDPEILNTIETLTREIEKINNTDIFVGKIFSINDILKEINQALHENNPEFHTIPQDKQTISQEFLLFENSGSDDLEKVVDSTFRKTRVTIKTPWVDAIILNTFIKDIEMRFNQAFSGKADISVTGMMALMARAMTAAIQSTSKSYVLAFFVISLMMVFLVGNVKIGLYSMIPNILPIVSVLCMMELAGMPIGMTTLLSIGVCIGIVVDDTIHFIYVYRKNYDLTGDAVLSMQETFLSTGRAVLITTLILISVFGVNFFCSMKNIVRFGAINSLIIFVALLFDFFLLPALLFLLSEKKSKQLSSFPEKLAVRSSYNRMDKR